MQAGLQNSPSSISDWSSHEHMTQAANQIPSPKSARRFQRREMGVEGGSDSFIPRIQSYKPEQPVAMAQTHGRSVSKSINQQKEISSTLPFPTVMGQQVPLHLQLKPNWPIQEIR